MFQPFSALISVHGRRHVSQLIVLCLQPLTLRPALGMAWGAMDTQYITQDLIAIDGGEIDQLWDLVGLKQQDHVMICYVVVQHQKSMINPKRSSEAKPQTM